MMKEEYRIEKAIELFKEGFNCSQAVVTAFADKYGFTKEQALNSDRMIQGLIISKAPLTRGR